MLIHIDARTLHNLKGVDPVWRKRARETLCHDDWRQKQPYNVAWAADMDLFTTSHVKLDNKLRSVRDMERLCEVLVASTHIEALR